jgi:hypothetical protein
MLHCNGLNFISGKEGWVKIIDDVEYTYCSYCKNSYNIQNIDKIGNIPLLRFYCDSYLLKPQIKKSLFTISMWSPDNYVNYDYNIRKFHKNNKYYYQAYQKQYQHKYYRENEKQNANISGGIIVRTNQILNIDD